MHICTLASPSSWKAFGNARTLRNDNSSRSGLSRSSRARVLLAWKAVVVDLDELFIVHYRRSGWTRSRFGLSRRVKHNGYCCRSVAVVLHSLTQSAALAWEAQVYYHFCKISKEPLRIFIPTLYLKVQIPQMLGPFFQVGGHGTGAAWTQYL